MAKPCKYFEVCGLDADADPEAGLCILHSEDPNKDKQAFAEALERHREEKGDNFSWIVFPEKVDFSNAKFSEEANFSGATFSKETDFSHAEFSERANFSGATFSMATNFDGAKFKAADFSDTRFSKAADFSWATFSEAAYFVGAMFSKEVNFGVATFSKVANFVGATFSEEAKFDNATFFQGAHFGGTVFERDDVTFAVSSFLGKTLFIGRQEERIPIFSGINVDFRNVNIDPLDALIFRDADLSLCRFQGTDLRKAEFTGVSWPEISKHLKVYDEIVPLEKGQSCPWHHIERIYREPKQNYEDRRDYERAGDFHYGEKEMRRQNPETSPMLRFFLTIYWLISGYGERYIRPLIWAFFLLLACTFGYLVLGIAPGKGGALLAVTKVRDWLHAGLYSLQVMTLLRPTDLVPIGLAATGVKVVQGILGPIIIGLFALALRQRLKR